MPIPISNKDPVIVVLRPLVPPLPKPDQAQGRTFFIVIQDPENRRDSASAVVDRAIRRVGSSFVPGPPPVPPLP